MLDLETRYNLVFTIVALTIGAMSFFDVVSAILGIIALTLASLSSYHSYKKNKSQREYYDILKEERKPKEDEE